MNILNNSELIKELTIIDIIFAVFAVALYFREPIAILPVIAVMTLVDVVIYIFSKRRYKKIVTLSNGIDMVLYGQKDILISDCKEGELSVLENEISKMTMKLKEQNDLLLNDKVKLTNAIADIFHQLRTPLTSMNINLALLEEEELSLNERLELTRKIYKQLERIQWLVESLLKISKIDAKTAQFYPENVTIDELLNKALEPLMVPLDIKNINLVKQIDKEGLKVDINWTAECIGNILKNCIEHTQEGGEIRIKAFESVLYTQIIISDNGEGFSDDDIPHLFERFYNGKNATKDSIGIGLSLARMIVMAQNGTITAYNCKDGGAVFDIKFYKNII